MARYSSLNNNPIYFADPDGDTVRFRGWRNRHNGRTSAEALQIWNSIVIYYLINNILGLDSLTKSKAIYDAYLMDDNTLMAPGFIMPYTSNGIPIARAVPTLYINPWYSIVTTNNYRMSPAETNDHEIGHALLYDKDPCQAIKDANTPAEKYGNVGEQKVITGREQRTARKIGTLIPGQRTRSDHSDKGSYRSSSFGPDYGPTPTQNPKHSHNDDLNTNLISRQKLI